MPRSLRVVLTVALVALAVTACSVTVDGSGTRRTTPAPATTSGGAGPRSTAPTYSAIPLAIRRVPTRTVLGEPGHVDLCTTATFSIDANRIGLRTANTEPFGQCAYDANTSTGIFPVVAYASTISRADPLGRVAGLTRVHGHVVERLDRRADGKCLRVVRLEDIAIVVETFNSTTVAVRDACGAADVVARLFAVNDAAAKYRTMPVPATNVGEIDFCLALPQARAATIMGVRLVSTTSYDFDTVCTWQFGSRQIDAQAAMTSVGYELPDPDVHLGGHALVTKCTGSAWCEVDAPQPSLPGSRRTPFVRITVNDTSFTARTASTRLAGERAAVAILDAAGLS